MLERYVNGMSMDNAFKNAPIYSVAASCFAKPLAFVVVELGNEVI